EVTASGSVGGWSLGSIDFQPIPTQTIGTSFAFPLWSNSFTLPGFQSVTQQGLTVAGRLHPAPALASVSPTQVPLIIVPYLYNATTLPSNVVNGTTTLTVKGVNFPNSGSQAYFSIHGSAPVALPTTTVD